MKKILCIAIVLFTTASAMGTLRASPVDHAGRNCRKPVSKVAGTKSVERHPLLTGISEFIVNFNVPDQNGTWAFNLSPELRPYFVLEIGNDPRFFHVRNNAVWLNAAPSLRVEVAGIPAATVSRWRENAANRLLQLDNGRLAQATVAEAVACLSLAKDGMRQPAVDDWVRQIAALQAVPLEAAFHMSAPQAFQFAKALVQKQLGLPYLPVTDIVEFKNEGQPTRLAAVAIDDIARGEVRVSPLTPSLRYLTNVRAVKSSDRAGKLLGSGTVRWQVGENHFSANYRHTAGKMPQTITPALKTADYKAMLGDGKLTGMILADHNMGADTRSVLNEYREYFRDQGFRFSRPRKISDNGAFIDELVASGAVDYVIKEAHSHGGRDFISLVKGGQVVTGRRKLTGGKSEVIHLLYPAGRGNPEAIEYSSIGTAMERRAETENSPPLILCDTSCMAIGRGDAITGAVGTPKFIFVGSEDIVSTFTNESDTPLYHLLNGLRKQKTFPEIRKGIRKGIAEAKNGYEENDDADDPGAYLFPDQPKWQTAIKANRGGRPIVSEIQVLDSAGQPYNVDSLRDGR